MSPCFFSLSSRPQDMDQRRGAERSLKLLIPSRYRCANGRQLSSTSNGRREEREEEGKGEGEEKPGERGGCEGLSAASDLRGKADNSSLHFPHSLSGASPHQHPSKRASEGGVGHAAAQIFPPDYQVSSPQGLPQPRLGPTHRWVPDQALY